MKLFSEFELSSVLKTNLAANGFVETTPIQAQAINPALSGRDLIATAQTGTGKTLAFLVPLIERLMRESKPGIRAVVLSPTRELAMQIHETFQKIAPGSGLRAAVVVGGVPEKIQLHALRKGASVVIATPGRLVDFMDRKLARLGAAEIVVLDESDRMLDMGFLPTIRRILGETPMIRQTLLFSATLENSVRPLIQKYLTDPVRIEMGPVTKVAENVDLRFYEVEPNEKMALLESLLRQEPGSTLVFARTKHGTERLAKHLNRAGYNAGRIHGDRTQGQRNAALKSFQHGEFRVLVATDVASRGIHVDGIAHVVNYDLPQVAEDFVHRVGRTARAGAKGTASTFGSRSERGKVREIEKTLSIRLPRIERLAAAL
jgi:ATP-dependent RNA helicase RhlE